MPATNYPEFNAAVTELTDRVELLLTDVGKMQSVASVQVAADKAAEASTSATAAASSATAANGSKTAAASSATAAASSATAANTSKVAAASSATAADSSKTAAAASATAASTAATNAGNSATAADASKVAAANSATAADSSKTASAGSATAAASSATAASSSSTKASQWADAAENTVVETGKYSAKHHAAKAAASATAADGSKTAAAGSATSASTSASTATTKATEAAASATSAANSATSASTAKLSAESARDQAVTAASALTGSLSELGSIDLSSGVYPAKPAIAAFWKVTVGGTAGGVTYGVGDTLVYSKSLDQFYKIDNTESVSSVNGATGAVAITPASISAQPTHANLSALSGLTGTADKLPYFTGAGALSVAVLTAKARGLLASADEAAMRTFLGLGTAALANLTASATDVTAGRVLKVGDFGLGALLGVSDADSVPSGSSLCVLSSPFTRGPTASAYLLVSCVDVSFSNGTQLAIPWAGSTGTYRRVRASGVWGAWVEIWTSGNLVKQTGAGDATAGRVLLTGAHNLGAGQFAKNKIINGKMEIAQRGNSFPTAAPVSYTLDQWSYNGTSTSVDVMQEVHNPPVVGIEEFQTSLRATVSTARTPAGADSHDLRQTLEGYNIRDLVGKTFTLSFRVRSSKVGVHCVSFANSIPDRTYIGEYTVNVANTWESKKITVVGGLTPAGTWLFGTGLGLRVRWALGAGPSSRATAEIWQSGNFFASPNQVNCLDTVGNIFAITGVQLEVGEVATPFEHRPYGQELALCQRYYENTVICLNSPVAGTTGAFTYFAVQKRATPTLIAGTVLESVGFGAVFNNQVSSMGFKSYAQASYQAYHTQEYVANAEL